METLNKIKEAIKKLAHDFLNPPEEEVLEEGAKEWEVSPRDVISINPQGALLLGGEAITQNELEILDKEAIFLKNSRLWQIMQMTIRQKAIEKAVLMSTDFEQVLSGKLMIHNLGIQKDILDKILNLAKTKR
jgi:hypothetical protein